METILLIRERCFFVLPRAWDKEKNSESPCWIEPQTIGFRLPILYHSTVSEVYYEVHRRAFPIGFFNPAVPTKIVSQSCNPKGLYRPIPIPIIQFCPGPFPKPKRAFLVGDDFLNQHWSVEVYSRHKAWVYFFSPKSWFMI